MSKTNQIKREMFDHMDYLVKSDVEYRFEDYCDDHRHDDCKDCDDDCEGADEDTLMYEFYNEELDYEDIIEDQCIMENFTQFICEEVNAKLLEKLLENVRIETINEYV